MKGLSKLQRAILAFTLGNRAQPSPSHWPHVHARDQEILAALWGGPTPAARASLSRALARLQQRGLVSRWRGLYRAGISLTQQGERVAREATVNKVPFVNLDNRFMGEAAR